MRQESCSRIEEHADNNRQHRIRKNVHVECIIRHHQSCDDAEKYNQCEQQRQTPFPLVIIFSEQVEIEHEAEHQHTDKQDLSSENLAALSHGLIALDGLFAQ